MVRRFDPGGRGGGFCGSVMKERVGQWAADAFVEQDEQGSHFGALLGEVIRVAPALAFEEAVGAQLADVVAQLGEGIRLWGDPKGLEHGAVHLGGAPAGELGPPWRRTSIRRSMRGSWILMPGRWCAQPRPAWPAARTWGSRRAR